VASLRNDRNGNRRTLFLDGTPDAPRRTHPMGDDRLEPASASADGAMSCEKPQTAGGANCGAAGAETALSALARALLELPEDDRRRLLKLLQSDDGGR